MPVRPKGPWYRKSKDAWYVELHGKQVMLAKGRTNKQFAWKRFHTLMATAPARPVIRSDSTVALFDGFLEWCQKNRASANYEWYRQRLERFATVYPDLAISELRPFHLQEFIDGITNLNVPSRPVSDTTRRNYARAVTRALTWAVQMA